MSKSETLQDQTTSYLEWMRDTLLPHELQTTTNARGPEQARLAALKFGGDRL